MTALSVGARLGPYEILGTLGAGGMGEVYKATDTRLDRTVAIKVLASFWAGNPEMKQRFDREAQTIAALNHPHICVLHDIGQQDGLDYLVPCSHSVSSRPPEGGHYVRFRSRHRYGSVRLYSRTEPRSRNSEPRTPNRT